MTSHEVGGIRNVTTCDKDGGGVKKRRRQMITIVMEQAVYQSINELLRFFLNAMHNFSTISTDWKGDNEKLSFSLLLPELKLLIPS